MATDNKYDRQLRLWGPNGQRLLNDSHVLLLNCEPSGVELVKNLVLPGIGHISIMDDKKICERDLGNNFFVDEDNLNKDRAEVICKYLLEMNMDVQGKFIVQNPYDLVQNKEKNEEFLKGFSLIIINEMPEEYAVKLNEVCEKLRIHLIYLYTVGLIGYIRVFGNDHTVIESKPPDTQIEDLRILEPFPELKEFVDSFDLQALDEMEHGHVPYVVLLVKILEEWKKNVDLIFLNKTQYFQKNNKDAPSSFQEKSDFKNFIKTFARDFATQENFQEASKNYYKSFKQNSELPLGLEKIFNSDFCLKADKNSKHFWILAKALQEFYSEFKCLPLIGKIPDMTALTSFYVKLQNVYKAKAESDVKKMMGYVNKTTDKITYDEVKTFCENCWTLEWINFRTLSKEDTKPNVLESYENDVYKWYLAVKGCQLFENKYKTCPADKNKEELEKIVNEDLIKNKFPNILPIEKEIIEEITRYEGAHLHNIAALVGGVGSQEAIKLLTCQFLPLNNTFIFNGITCEAAVFEL